jgi:hypothetical protein
MALDVIRLIPRLNGAGPSQRDWRYFFVHGPSQRERPYRWGPLGQNGKS